jgi:DNA topoisomerase-1
MSTTAARTTPALPVAISSAEELADPVASAQAAGLRYVSDETPGIRRRRAGKGFSYTGPDGKPVRDEKTLARIKSLAIPPAWTDVWISPDPRGHLQATGRDARGRKQYRYHPQWRNVRDAVKYDHLIAFAEALPRIRQRVQEDLAKTGLSREKVLATCVRLLEETHIRVGNDEYRKQNKSFGLTTLQDRHAQVTGSIIRFRFRGKHGIVHEVKVADRRLARIVKRCQDIPGQELFQYYDDEGNRHDVTSGDVNEYLREISGLDVTAKVFRTWAGTMLAARFFRECEPGETKKEVRSQVVRTIERVAERLGNTVAICRKCYVHPAIVDAYLAGQVLPADEAPEDVLPDAPEHGLSAEERATLAFLKEQAQAAAGDGGAEKRKAA